MWVSTLHQSQVQSFSQVCEVHGKKKLSQVYEVRLRKKETIDKKMLRDGLRADLLRYKNK